MNPQILSTELSFWVCAACAQTFATLTALTGIFGVFKLQQVNGMQDSLSTKFGGLVETMASVGREKYWGFVVAHLPESITKVDLREGMQRWSFDTGFKPWLQALREDGPDTESRTWAAQMLMQAHLLLVALKTLGAEYDRCLRVALVPVMANGVAVVASLASLATLKWQSEAAKTLLPLALVAYGAACVAATLVCIYLILYKPGAIGRRVVSVADPPEDLHG